MSKATQRAYYFAHCLESWRRSKAWRQRNPQRHRENQRRWRDNHPGYMAAWRAARKAKSLPL